MYFIIVIVLVYRIEIKSVEYSETQWLIPLVEHSSDHDTQINCTSRLNQSRWIDTRAQAQFYRINYSNVKRKILYIF